MAKIADLLNSKNRNDKKSSEILKKATIVRGSVHLVGFPFKIEVPLEIFHCCNNNCTVDIQCRMCTKLKETHISCEQCNILNREVFDHCKGTIMEYTKNNLLEFSSVRKGSDEYKNIPINTVQKLKVRPFLILSADDIDVNISRRYGKFLYGAPIYSVKKEQLEDSTYMDLLKNNKILSLYYLDKKVQGVNKPSYIDLCCLMPIHINLILQYRGYLESKEMKAISDKITVLLDLNRFNNIEDIDLLQERKNSLEEELKHIDGMISKIKEVKKIV